MPINNCAKQQQQPTKKKKRKGNDRMKRKAKYNILVYYT